MTERTRRTAGARWRRRRRRSTRAASTWRRPSRAGEPSGPNTPAPLSPGSTSRVDDEGLPAVGGVVERLVDDGDDETLDDHRPAVDARRTGRHVGGHRHGRTRGGDGDERGVDAVVDGEHDGGRAVDGDRRGTAQPVGGRQHDAVGDDDAARQLVDERAPRGADLDVRCHRRRTVVGAAGEDQHADRDDAAAPGPTRASPGGRSRRAARDQRRRGQHELRAAAPAEHPVDEQPERRAAHLLPRLVDGGQRDMAEAGEEACCRSRRRTRAPGPRARVVRASRSRRRRRDRSPRTRPSAGCAGGPERPRRRRPPAP